MNVAPNRDGIALMAQRTVSFKGVATVKLDLSGKRAVVTASTGGLGLTIATGLAEAGAEVVLNGRKQDAIDAASAQIRQSVPDAKLLSCAADAGTRAGCDALI